MHCSRKDFRLHFTIIIEEILALISVLSHAVIIVLSTPFPTFDMFHYHQVYICFTLHIVPPHFSLFFYCCLLRAIFACDNLFVCTVFIFKRMYGFVHVFQGIRLKKCGLSLNDKLNIYLKINLIAYIKIEFLFLFCIWIKRNMFISKMLRFRFKTMKACESSWHIFLFVQVFFSLCLAKPLYYILSM